MVSDRYLVGIDSGGSKSQLMVWTESGAQQLAANQASEQEILASAVCTTNLAGINLDVIDPLTASKRLGAILEYAADSVHLSTTTFLQRSRLVMGLAGLDTPADEQRANDWFRSVLLQLDAGSTPFTLLPDVELALWSANPSGSGIVLIAGTGSNCYGRDLSGKKAKAGGMSHFFSDEGGGFMLGWEALHLLNKMHDGRLEKTALYEQLLRRYEVPDFAALKTTVVSAHDYKHLVARAAPVVQQLAAEGEPNCVQIVHQAVNELTEMVVTVADQLGSHELYVYLVGGLFKDGPYRQQLIESLYSQGLRSQPMRVESPVVGVIYWFGRGSHA